jgi:hypothetical protein
VGAIDVQHRQNQMRQLAHLVSRTAPPPTRRNLSKGQQAMALAMIYPEPKRGMHSQLGHLTGEFTKERLSKARLVYRELPAVAALVIAGSKSLDEAYAEAQRQPQSPKPSAPNFGGQKN